MRRRFDIAVAEQLPNHWQGLAQRQRAGREGVTEVVQPNVFQPVSDPDGLPDMVETAAAETPFTVDP